MGPVLALHAANERAWALSALVVAADEPAPLEWRAGDQAGSAAPTPLWRVSGRTAFRFVFEVPLEDRPSSFTYTVTGASFGVQLPARGASPNVAYASCNGFSLTLEMNRVENTLQVWDALRRRHQAISGYHLLLLGGDQVYADELFAKVEIMEQWVELPYRVANAAPATPEMIAAVEAFYFNLYAEGWSKPEIAYMLARVPMLAMWDDHEIVDGWGSYPEERQNCDVFQKAIWPAARRAFATFQQQLDVAKGERHAGALAPEHGFSRGHVLGRIAFLVPDLRSERTVSQVLSRAHWDKLFDWVDALPDLDHLLVVSSIPVVFPSFDALERLLGFLPGQQELEDDLRDRWTSRPHQDERLRLVHRLLGVARRGTRPTIVSGDVHFAALGRIESRKAADGACPVVNQLVSSAIVHPAPHATVLLAMRVLFDLPEDMGGGIVANMSDFPGTKARFIGRRNFLSLEPDAPGGQRRISAHWFVENEEHPYTKVIHACRA